VAVDSIKAGSMGMVKVEGEYWKAKALEDISEGDSIIVVDFDGLSVTVKRADHG